MNFIKLFKKYQHYVLLCAILVITSSTFMIMRSEGFGKVKNKVQRSVNSVKKSTKTLTPEQEERRKELKKANDKRQQKRDAISKMMVNEKKTFDKKVRELKLQARAAGRDRGKLQQIGKKSKRLRQEWQMLQKEKEQEYEAAQKAKKQAELNRKAEQVRQAIIRDKQQTRDKQQAEINQRAAQKAADQARQAAERTRQAAAAKVDAEQLKQKEMKLIESAVRRAKDDTEKAKASRILMEQNAKKDPVKPAFDINTSNAMEGTINGLKFSCSIYPA